VRRFLYFSIIFVSNARVIRIGIKGLGKAWLSVCHKAKVQAAVSTKELPRFCDIQSEGAVLDD
jgi:hypothetical protein